MTFIKIKLVFRVMIKIVKNFQELKSTVLDIKNSL